MDALPVFYSHRGGRDGNRYYVPAGCNCARKSEPILVLCRDRRQCVVCRGGTRLVIGIPFNHRSGLFFHTADLCAGFQRQGLPWLAAFVGCAVATNGLSLKRRRMEERLLHAHNELEQRVSERTQDLRQTNERLITEIAERTRAETALRETQNELARAARIMTVGELTSSIAHEINQPLAAVMSNAEAALNWLQRNPPALPQTKESVAAIIAAGGRAGDIIIRIRSLIKRGSPDLTRLNINDVIDSVLATARAGFKTQNVVIERRL